MLSLPSRERGLKCKYCNFTLEERQVAPFAGAWIEIVHILPSIAQTASLPSRERGLKSEIPNHPEIVAIVAPFAGAWIEMASNAPARIYSAVAPFAGAWIEIALLCSQLPVLLSSLPSRERGLKFLRGSGSYQHKESLPSRERGLKYVCHFCFQTVVFVAPFAGAWIEICLTGQHKRGTASLPSRERGLK